MVRLLSILRVPVFAVAALLFIGGCASNGNPQDPFEPVNRGIYKFNDVADHLIVKPAAEIYRGVVPPIVRTGVSNFFSNIDDVIVALNSLLQGKVSQAALDASRVLVNTTIGLLGVFDVATNLGLDKHNEDFGQTLGYWGLGSGPYVVLPFLGPSSARDSVGLVGDYFTDPKTYIDPVRDRHLVWGLYFVSRRSELLDASKVLEVAALDEYEFVRDAYLQRRRNLVYDGNPPDEDDPQPQDNPKPSGGDASSPAPSAADGGKDVQSILISGDRVPTPAELEDSRKQESAQGAAANPPSQPARMTRIWLHSGNN